MLRVRVYVFITDIDFRVAALIFMRSSQDRMSGLQEKVFMAGQKLSARVDVFRCEDVICLVGRFVVFLLGICSWGFKFKSLSCRGIRLCFRVWSILSFSNFAHILT